MPQTKKQISLVYFVIITLLLVGFLPLLLTGWFLSDRSARELRAAENRYQIQLVTEKAVQIETFGRRYTEFSQNLARAFELTNNLSLLSAPETETQLGEILKKQPDLIAIQIKTATGQTLDASRSDQITENELVSISGGVSEKSVATLPTRIGSSGMYASAFSAPIYLNGTLAANVTALVRLNDLGRNVVGISDKNEDELWSQGLPMVFVADSTGRALFHPDKRIVESERSLSAYKIVQEWQQANSQVQSALFPFSADHKGEAHDMIGAYSTVRWGNDTALGVFTMQDEKKALASVGEMRAQTWLISIAFALFALAVGFLLTRQLTTPLLKMVSAARQIADGDLTTRVEAKNFTEIGTLGDAFNTMTDKVEEQIAKLAKAAQENRELFVGTVKALAAAIDGKDHYTRGHSERVSRVSVAIGQRLGMSAEELETLRISALLHDVGKIAIDDSILKKPSALTDDEFEIMKTHPQKGYKIMSQIPAMKEFLPGMYMHHEMVNGQGYPQGLTNKQIPLQAKIVSVADTFDAMTIDRPYQKGMDLEAALARIQSFVDTRYDKAVVDALIHACTDGQIGVGVVKLKNNAPRIEPTRRTA